MPKLSDVASLWPKASVLFRRGSAVLLDAVVGYSILYVLFQIYIWVGLPLNNPFSLLLVMLAYLPLWLAEARWGRTPGKWLNGLKLSVTGGFGLRMGKVLLRTLIKVTWGVALVWFAEFLGFYGLRFLASEWQIYLFFLHSGYLFPVWAGVFYLVSVQLFKIPWFDAAYTWCGRTVFVNAHPRLGRSLIQVTMSGLLLYVGLTYFVWPQFTGPRGDTYPKNASVKANMHTLQTMIETYNVDSGRFPHSLSTLYQDGHLPDKQYWKDFSNPYTGETGFGKAFQMDRLPPYKGIVTYAPEPAVNGVITRYWIYGYDKHARRILDRASEFALTNS